MKKLVLLLAISGMAFAVNSQNDKKEAPKEKPKTEQAALKEHACSSSCKDGKHVYAHGEKGHTCSDACKKKM